MEKQPLPRKSLQVQFVFLVLPISFPSEQIQKSQDGGGNSEHFSKIYFIYVVFPWPQDLGF